jgi:hypothetical protein
LVPQIIDAIRRDNGEVFCVRIEEIGQRQFLPILDVIVQQRRVGVAVRCAVLVIPLGELDANQIVSCPPNFISDVQSRVRGLCRCLAAGISFLAVLLIPDDVRMKDYGNNLLGGLAMQVWGLPWMKLLLQAFVVVIIGGLGRSRSEGDALR